MQSDNAPTLALPLAGEGTGHSSPCQGGGREGGLPPPSISALRKPARRFGSIGNHLAHWREALDRLLGLPNYERYLAHMQQVHPGQATLSRRAFYDEAQRNRYESGADRPRCC